MEGHYLYRAGKKGPSASRQTCACYIAGKFRRLWRDIPRLSELLGHYAHGCLHISWALRFYSQNDPSLLHARRQRAVRNGKRYPPSSQRRVRLNGTCRLRQLCWQSQAWDIWMGAWGAKLKFNCFQSRAPTPRALLAWARAFLCDPSGFEVSSAFWPLHNTKTISHAYVQPFKYILFKRRSPALVRKNCFFALSIADFEYPLSPALTIKSASSSIW